MTLSKHHLGAEVEQRTDLDRFSEDDVVHMTKNGQSFAETAIRENLLVNHCSLARISQDSSRILSRFQEFSKSLGGS